MAALAVINTTELLEQILVHLDIKTLLLSQCTCKLFKNTIDGSPLLQYALFYTLDRPKDMPEDRIKANILFSEHDVIKFKHLLSAGRVLDMSWEIGLHHQMLKLDMDMFLTELGLSASEMEDLPPPTKVSRDPPGMFTFWYDEEEEGQKEMEPTSGNESWRRMYFHRDKRMVYFIEGRCNRMTDCDGIHTGDCDGPDTLFVHDDYVTMGELMDRAIARLTAHLELGHCFVENVGLSGLALTVANLVRDN